MKGVQYFIAVIKSQEGCFNEIISEIQNYIEDLDSASTFYDFTQTNYYEKEMGLDLKRFFIPLKKPRPAYQLAQIKQQTNFIEKEKFTINQKRFANLDPGYLDFGKIVLASNKFANHKIEIAENIFADVVLNYQNGLFKPFPWTFPDFASGMYDEFFVRLREKYKV